VRLAEQGRRDQGRRRKEGDEAKEQREQKQNIGGVGPERGQKSRGESSGFPFCERALLVGLVWPAPVQC
jgi:hypothetical protein